MSFQEFEVSLDGGQPNELYELRIGAEDPYRFTSGEDDVTIAGLVYSSVTAKRSKIEAGPQKRSAELTVTVPSSHPFVLRYVGIIPGKRARLTISAYHRSDGATPEVVVRFFGFVETVKFQKNGHEAVIVARSDLSAFSQPMPVEGYQTQCNNVLYGTDCGVDRTDPAYRLLNAGVDFADGRFLTISGAAAFDDDWFAGGRATIGNGEDHRMILAHTGNEIELMFPFPSAPSEITLFAGCAHVLPVCAVKFSNGVNYRGHFFVPFRNPYTDGVQ